ncbi:hypothetical protein KUTeg_019039 [Tegillarca granosa]|uniref:Uncharacterized protein n=1 Tax=Tegillarca granosa TaxID=220873 RepID=A0ABQ9EBB8_TEGGR|nr:hypothetical protein KUTeg_019039 [Tegillarca granosa]
MDHLKDKKQHRVLATHVLQFVFLGFTGFRFAFAHFPSTTASATDLYLLMWKSVNMLSMFGFKIQNISTDGAQTNRDLFKLLIPNFNSASPSPCSFHNIYCKDNPNFFFIMDISHVTRQDIISSLLGFEELCHYKLKLSHSSIIPRRVNSDVVENIFCQQRTLHNGANTNPTYLGYCRSLNSVVFGETSVSRKSNTGGEGASIYKVESSNVLKKITRKLMTITNFEDVEADREAESGEACSNVRDTEPDVEGCIFDVARIVLVLTSINRSIVLIKCANSSLRYRPSPIPEHLWSVVPPKFP